MSTPLFGITIDGLVKIFEEIEKAGTEINYRCLYCSDVQNVEKEALLRKSVSKRILSNKLLKKVFPLILKIILPVPTYHSF